MKEREQELIKELGQLQKDFYLSDKSDENIERGKRIIEIKKELGLETKPKKNRRPPRVINK